MSKPSPSKKLGDALSKGPVKKKHSVVPGGKDDFPLVTSIEEFLKESKDDFMKKFNATKESSTSEGSIEDFEKLRTLGTGSFGRVMLVKHKKRKTYYAVKILSKQKVVKRKQVDHTLYEKRILMSTKFPFLVHMDYFYKDNSNLYFVMPFVMGGEMFTYLRRVGKFSEDLTRFYSSQVILAFEYLHNLNLIYRDLKPENIMLDNTGYLKITDFGFCKMVEGRTWTMCGTPEYIAPEIILSKGYGKSVDWWSVGILIFEMAAGHPPFYSEDPMKIYEKIASGRYVNPAHFSVDLKDLIKNFLQVDLTRRYGNMKNGVQDIKDHKWLKSVDWLSVLNRKITPSYIPKIKNPGDTSHFDKHDEQPIKIASVDKFKKEFEKF